MTEPTQPEHDCCRRCSGQLAVTERAENEEHVCVAVRARACGPHAQRTASSAICQMQATSAWWWAKCSLHCQRDGHARLVASANHLSAWCPSCDALGDALEQESKESGR